MLNGNMNDLHVDDFETDFEMNSNTNLSDTSSPFPVSQSYFVEIFVVFNIEFCSKFKFIIILFIIFYIYTLYIIGYALFIKF